MEVEEHRKFNPLLQFQNTPQNRDNAPHVIIGQYQHA